MPRQIALALDLVERADAHDGQRRRRPGGPAEAERTARVDAGRDHEHLRGDALAALVGGSAGGCRRRSVATNAASATFRQHLTVHVQVRAVGGEAERDSRQPADDEARHRRVVGEVAVHVVDAVSLHPASDVRDLREEAERADEGSSRCPQVPRARAPGAQVMRAAGGRSQKSWLATIAGRGTGGRARPTSGAASGCTTASRSRSRG